MRRSFYICESQDRWHRAVSRFAAEMMVDDDDTLVIHRVDFPRALAMSKSWTRSDVILWELANVHAADLIQSMDRLSSRSDSPLQLVALPPDLHCEPTQRTSLQLSLRQTGVLAVLEHPLELSLCTAALRRNWQRQSRHDNLATVQRIWQRLPWAPAQS